MSTPTLTEDEFLAIWQEALAEAYSTTPALHNRADRVNELVQEKKAHALQMKALRVRVDAELQGAIW